MTQPAWTPVVADGAVYITYPVASDLPARNLYSGDSDGTFGMNVMNLPRHGNHSAPRNWPPSLPLPGRVNVGFFDGHAESVKLDRLWQLYWHADYVPPAKRPGLP